MTYDEKENLKENIKDIEHQIKVITHKIALENQDYENKLQNKKFFENLEMDHENALFSLNLKLKDLKLKKKELEKMLEDLM